MTDLRNREAITLCLVMALGLALTGVGIGLLVNMWISWTDPTHRGPIPIGAPLALVGGIMNLTLALGALRVHRIFAVLLMLLSAALVPMTNGFLIPEGAPQVSIFPALPIILVLVSIGYLVAPRQRLGVALAVSIAGLSLANLFAPILDLPHWARLTLLPELNLLTAVFTLITAFVLVLLRFINPHSFRNYHKAVLLIGVIGIGLTVACWHLIREHNQQDATRQARLLANHTGQALEAFYQDELALVHRLAERIQVAGPRVPAHLWDIEAKAYLRDFPHIELIALLDGRRRFMNANSRGPEPRFWLNSMLESDGFNRWLDHGQEHTTSYASPPLPGVKGATSVLVFGPVESASDTNWTVLAVINLNKALGWLRDWHIGDLTVTISSDGKVLFGTAKTNQDLVPLWQESFVLHHDTEWTVTVSERLNARNLDDYLGEVLVLFGGLALTTLLMLNRLFGLMTLERNRRLAEHLEDEQQLREANNQIIRFSSDLLCTVDRYGVFRFISPASQEILGYTPEEMINRPAREFIHEDYLDATVRIVGTVISGEVTGEQQFRNRYYHKDGHEVPLDWKGRWSAEEGVLFCVGRDMTAELKAEELAHQREEFFSLTPEMFCIISPDNRFIEINNAFISVLGYDRTDLIGHVYLDIVHPDHHGRALRALEELASGNTVYELEMQVFRKNGDVRWLRLNASISNDQLMYCSARDITEERLVQSELRHSEELLRVAEQAGRIGGWMVDVETGKSSWSDAVCDIHEVPHGRVPDVWEALAYYTPEYQALVEESFRLCVEVGMPFDLEGQIRTANGRLRWVRAIGRAVRDDSGRIVRLQGAVQDISASKEASEQIRRLAERQSRIFESITDAFFTLDRGWRFTFMNQRCEELLRCDRSDVLGANIWEAFPEAVGSEIEERYRRAMQSGDTESFETYFEPVDLWAEVHAYPSEDGLAVYFRSIKQRKEAEARLQTTLQELERSNRELQDFAFVASHDLQEPLRKIQTFSDRLLRQPEHFDERELDYLTRMQSAASRMQNLILDLLSYSRVSTRTQPFQSCDLNIIIDEVKQDLETTISSNNAIVNVEPLPPVKGDASQLRQVIQNLISNAIKFHRPEESPRILVYPEHVEGDGWTLVVQDNGTGFDPKYGERMFQPFQRLHNKNEYKGTGIGLAIVRKIIDRHQATITADGRPGMGATFRIRFSCGPDERPGGQKYGS